MIDRAKLFAEIRAQPFSGRMNDKQVEGVNRIVDEWERRGLKDFRWLAYILATAKWETAHTMQPIREGGRESYLKSKPYYPWVGEGLVQVTWEVNHRKFGATAPGQLMTWPIALRAIFDGMIKGMFTSHKLADHFNATKTDWVNARRIVNGTDKANEIAAIAKQFYSAIVEASDKKPIPTPPIKPSTPIPGKTVGTVVVAGAGGVAAKASGWTWGEAAGVVLALAIIFGSVMLIFHVRNRGA